MSLTVDWRIGVGGRRKKSEGDIRNLESRKEATSKPKAQKAEKLDSVCHAALGENPSLSTHCNAQTAHKTYFLRCKVVIMRHFESILAKQNIFSLISMLVAFLFLLRLCDVISHQLIAPFDLIYETPNLSTIKLIQAGKNPYNPEIYSNVPFIITIYTPLYHYITAGLPLHYANPFLLGRIVSMMSMLLAASVLFLVFPRDKGSLIFVSFLAFATYFSFWPVISNTAFLKNDPLALFLSVFAVALAFNLRNQDWAPVLVAFLSILAIMAKQSYVSAAGSCLLYYLASNRRYCTRFIVSMLLFSMLIAVMATSYWGPGFWFSTVHALRQAVTFQQGYLVVRMMLRQPMFVFLLILTALSIWLSVKGHGAKVFHDSPYLIYVLFSGTILFLTVGKTGSSTNYFFEFLIAQLMWAVYAAGKNFLIYPRKPLLSLILLAFIFFSGVDVSCSKRLDYSFVDETIIAQRDSYYKKVKNDIKSLGVSNPSILNLFTHMHTYSITDRAHLNDPYLYMLLWKDGVLDSASLDQSISDNYFDVIMLPSRIGPTSELMAPFDKIIARIFERYKLGLTGSGFNYYIRKT
jgi:hypothetical protein